MAHPLDTEIPSQKVVLENELRHDRATAAEARAVPAKAARADAAADRAKLLPRGTTARNEGE